MSLTKIDLIKSVYEKSGLRRKECVSIVDRLFEIIKDEMDQRNDR